MEIKVGIPKKNLTELHESLRNFLANTYTLYLKTQNFHWNVKGPQFFSLHLLFQKHYEELAEAVDEIAERLTSLESHVDGSFSDFNQRSTIKESKGMPSAEQMLQELVEGHETLCTMGRPFIRRFQELEDEVSADLMIKRLTFHEKAAWMLRSHLKK